MTTDRRPRIIVGVAPTTAGFRALRLAVATARERDAVLHAVRAFPFSIFLESIDARECSSRSQIWYAFDESMGGQPRDVEVVAAAVAGRPGRALVAYAHRDTDLLIVGINRRRWWRRLRRAHHSVATYCLTHSTCPVQAVPPDTFAITALRRGRGRRLSRQLDAALSRPARQG